MLAVAISLLPSMPSTILLRICLKNSQGFDDQAQDLWDEVSFSLCPGARAAIKLG